MVRQNVSHLEEKLRLKHEIAWLTDKLENKNITGGKISINDSPDTDNYDHSSFTVISHKKKEKQQTKLHCEEMLKEEHNINQALYTL